eukprot:3123385-Amphidinium_carterae.1
MCTTPRALNHRECLPSWLDAAVPPNILLLFLAIPPCFAAEMAGLVENYQTRLAMSCSGVRLVMNPQTQLTASVLYGTTDSRGPRGMFIAILGAERRKKFH